MDVDWGRGIEVIGEWVKRERDEVGGDPVGSTDLEVSRISHPCTFLVFKRREVHILGVQRPCKACFWR